MCYSKEVSLVAGTIITLHSSAMVWKYFLQNFLKASKANLQKHQQNFILLVCTSTFFLGLHQWAEYFAIDLMDKTI